MKTIVAASILSADFSILGLEIDRALKAGCEYIHFDVMDGVFVNNISYGIPVLESVARNCGATLDVHLMIAEPLKFVRPFAQSGADIITAHLESKSDIRATIKAIKEQNKKAGLSIKPSTPVEKLFPYLNDIDLVLLMTVEPGFGGQEFLNESPRRISMLKEKLESMGLDIPIEVDGGINKETAKIVVEAGASVLVAGSYIFGASDIGEAVRSLKDVEH